MRLRKLRDLTLTVPSQPGRPAYVSAASGLVRVAAHFYVVADDELMLGVFSCVGATPGSLIRLFSGELPLSKDERKKRKPDCEALVVLPPIPRYPRGAMLALGSGSKSSRCRFALVPLLEDGIEAARIRDIDATALFEAAAKEVDDLNIEGAFVLRDQLVLMHRGNARHASNAVIAFDLQVLLGSIEHDDKIGKAEVSAARHYDLGKIDDVPLTVTDGAMLMDGTLIFAAVAEQTDSSYTDGPCIGAAIGTLDAKGNLGRIEFLEQPYKIEGVHAERHGDTCRIWLVSDADDVGVPSSLLYGELQ